MRFVILDHKPPQLNESASARTDKRHLDLMFEVEVGAKLKTMALIKLPLKPGDEVEAESLNDHRAEFLTFEGELSENRGTVIRFAQGSWNGELAKKASLNFHESSKNFPGESWEIRFEMDRGKLLRIS